MADEREYLGGMPQPTSRERDWAAELAPIIVRMVHGYKGDRQEIESQVARELYCSVAMLNAGN